MPDYKNMDSASFLSEIGTSGNNDDLKPYGWMPGGYTITCMDCPDGRPANFADWPMGAKRSWRCEFHARATKTKAQEVATND